MDNYSAEYAGLRLELENLRRTVDLLIKGRTVAPGARSAIDPAAVSVVNTYIELPKMKIEELLETVKDVFDLGNWEIEELFRPNPEFAMHRTIRDVALLALSQMGWQLRQLKELFRMHPETVADHITQIRRRIVAEPGLKEEYRELVSRIRAHECTVN